MIKVVLDTNIYISGILFAGKPREVLDLAIKGKIHVFISPDILSELRDVLSIKKFGFSPERVDIIIREIESITTMVNPAKKYSIVSHDSDDNIIIDCAMESRVEYIITGDNDLLCLNKYKSINIINPALFIEEYFDRRLTSE